MVSQSVKWQLNKRRTIDYCIGSYVQRIQSDTGRCKCSAGWHTGRR